MTRSNGKPNGGVQIRSATNVRVQIRAGLVCIEGLELSAKHVVQYLDRYPEDERPQALVRATEVGVFCLERASHAQELDFVRERCEAVVHDVTRVASAIPRELEAALLAKLGTEDGQVLAPIRQVVEHAGKVASEKLTEVRDTLRDELDPDRKTSTLGRSLNEVRALLDPDQSRSIQASVAKSIDAMSAADGVLAKRVKQTVAEQLQPLSEEVHRLTLEVRGEQAAAEALAETTAKGIDFEHQTLAEVEAWVQPIGGEVEHTGVDNKPGDITLTPGELLAAGGGLEPIVIECRDRKNAVGRKAVADTLDAAMAQRGAGAGIFLAGTPSALGKELGAWAEGRGKRGIWIATTRDNLFAAVRMILMLRRVEAAKASCAEVDERRVTAQATRIRTALRRIGQITRQVGIVRGGADAIQKEGDELRTEIASALAELEEVVRSGAKRPAKKRS
jgi:hypothetical protein